MNASHLAPTNQSTIQKTRPATVKALTFTIQIQTHAAALNLLPTSSKAINVLLVQINQATTAMTKHATVNLRLCIFMVPIVVDALTRDSISEIAISA